MATNERYHVIIPAYCPDEALIGLSKEVCDRGWKLYVVDDGGGEKYLPIFEQVDSRATILRHEVNRGKGAALKTALAHLHHILPEDSNAIIGTMDADGQHLPDDMFRVLEAATEHPTQLALGVRVVDGKMPFRSRFGNSITRSVFKLVTGTRVSDTQTGLRAFSASMIPMMLEIEGDRYEYEMDVLSTVARKKLGFCEVPIKTIYRDMENSTSHFRVFHDSVRIYKSLFKYFYKYVITAFGSFLLDFGLCCLFLQLFAHLPDAVLIPAASLGARLITSPLNYIANCFYVFKKRPTVPSALEYTLLCAVNIGISIGLQYLWNLLPVSLEICKLLAEICMFILSYVIQKRLIFKRK